MNQLNLRIQVPSVSALLTTLAGSLLIAGCGGDIDAGDEAVANQDPPAEAIAAAVLDESIHNIVAGTAVSDGERPFQVLLRYSGNFVCGGSLISPRTVLTAAHCRQGITKNYTVQYDTLSQSGGQIVQVINAISHPNYNSSTMDYDFAILHLATAITPGTNAAVIPMVDAGSDPSSGEAVVSGWGRTSGSGQQSQYLQKATLSLVARSTCNTSWGGNKITTRMLCASSPQQSGCEGDSGGPLTQDGKLIGVVSWGTANCNGKYFPNVFANIGQVRTWIDANTI